MNRADPAWSYSSVRQRTRPSGETTLVTIYTASDSRLVTPLMEEAQALSLNLFERAYRQGVERAEELCRQLFGGPRQGAPGRLC